MMRCPGRTPVLSTLFLLGLLLSGCSGPPSALEFRLAELEPGEGLEAMTFPGTGATYYLHPEVPIDETEPPSG